METGLFYIPNIYSNFSFYSNIWEYHEKAVGEGLDCEGWYDWDKLISYFKREDSKGFLDRGIREG